jgi:hypothetical protein
MNDDATAQSQLPAPDPALGRLDFLVGRWNLKGHLVASDEENIVGEATFEWLTGGFFLQQRTRIEFAGTFNVDSLELIGYDPETGRFPSTVYGNFSPDPLPYEWDVADGSLTISVSHGPLDATYQGEISADLNSFTGGWRPNPGADETVNIPYDVTVTRLE